MVSVHLSATGCALGLQTYERLGLISTLGLSLVLKFLVSRPTIASVGLGLEGLERIPEYSVIQIHLI